MSKANENRKGYKKTKLGWIPDEWEVLKSKDVIQFQGGAAFSSKDQCDEGVKWLKIANVGVGKAKWGTESYLPYSFLESNQNYKLSTGDVVMALTRPILNKKLKICKIKDEDGVSLLNQRVSKINVNENIDLDFSYYFFQTPYFVYSMEIAMAGTDPPNIGNADLYKIKIPLPPLPEQKKIAQILSTWDEAITTTENLIEKLKTRKKGLMQQLLTGKTRLKGFSGEWKSVKLGDVAERITKKNIELNDNVVTISAQRGFVKQEDFFNKRVASDTLSGYYLIEKGEFAYNKSYSKGYPMGAFKRLDELDKAVVTTLYICFKIKEKVVSDFMLDYFEAGLMINNLMKIAQEGGRAHGLLNISLGDFFSLELQIPEAGEQKAIAEILTTANEEINKNEKYLSELQTQKKGLMQKLLTGEVRVKINKEIE